MVIRFGAELTYNRRWEADVRAHLARHRYDYVIGSVHDWPESPYWPSRVRDWIEGRSLDEIVAPYYAEIIAAARSGLFDTIGHLDVVKRYLHPHVTAADLARRGRTSRSPPSGRSSNAAWRSKSTAAGFRYPGARDVSFRGRRGAVSRAGGRASRGRIRRPLEGVVRAPARTSRTATSRRPDSRR